MSAHQAAQRPASPEDAQTATPADTAPQRPAGEPTATSAVVLRALRGHRRPMTARQVAQAINDERADTIGVTGPPCGRHDARRLLNRLLEQGAVGWTPNGWIPLAENQPEPDSARPPAREPQQDPRRDPRMRRR